MMALPANCRRYSGRRLSHPKNILMMAKPITALELHYPMIQFLIMQFIHVGY